MTNKYILLFLLTMITVINSMPTESSDSGEQPENNPMGSSIKITRATQQHVDGSIHQIKTVGTTYRQRIQENQCLVEYDGELLAENSVIQIRKKYFRVENCLFERVFHACGPNLMFMLNIVCRVVEQDGSSTSHLNSQRDVSSSSSHVFDDKSNRVRRMITESCCENLCNVAEISRYCHT